MIKLNLNVEKIDKSALFKGTKGTYLDLTMFENRDGTDQYGNDGFVVQDIGKERRLAGEKGPILGNFKNMDQAPAPQSDPDPGEAYKKANEDMDSQSIPF